MHVPLRLTIRNPLSPRNQRQMQRVAKSRRAERMTMSRTKRPKASTRKASLKRRCSSVIPRIDL